MTFEVINKVMNNLKNLVNTTLINQVNENVELIMDIVIFTIPFNKLIDPIFKVSL